MDNYRDVREELFNDYVICRGLVDVVMLVMEGTVPHFDNYGDGN